MKGTIGILKVALLALVVGIALLFTGFRAGVAQGQPQVNVEELTETPSPEFAKEFPVPVKPLPKTITPCRACHGPEKDFPISFKRHEDLLIHTNVKLNHGGVRVWCLDCHHPDDRNHLLPLSDGKPIDFEHSYLLCGKCHGTKFRDWRNGIHGRRTGNWNGEKTYELCVSCHDPHSPKYKPIRPLPPPEKPWTPKEKQAKH